MRGQVRQLPWWMILSHVALVGKPAAARRYLTENLDAGKLIDVMDSLRCGWAGQVGV